MSSPPKRHLPDVRHRLSPSQQARVGKQHYGSAGDITSTSRIDQNNNGLMPDRKDEDENPPNRPSSLTTSDSEQANFENSSTDVSFVSARSHQSLASFSGNLTRIQSTDEDGFEYIKSLTDGFQPGSSTDPADFSSSSDNTIPTPGRVKSDELGVISKNTSRYKPHYCTGCSVDEYEKPAWCPDYKSIYVGTESDEEPMSDMCPNCKLSTSSLIGQTDVYLIGDSNDALSRDDEPCEHTILHADSSTSDSTVSSVASVSKLIDSQSESQLLPILLSTSPATADMQDLYLRREMEPDEVMLPNMESMESVSVPFEVHIEEPVSKPSHCIEVSQLKDEVILPNMESMESVSVPFEVHIEEPVSKPSHCIEVSHLKDDASSRSTEDGDVSSRASAVEEATLPLTEHNPAAISHGSDVVCTGDTKPTAVKHDSDIGCAGDTKEAVVKHEPTQCDTNVIVNDMHALQTNYQKPTEIGYVQSDLKNDELIPNPSQYIEESQLKDDASSRSTEDCDVSSRTSAVEEAKLPLTEHNPAAISHGSDVVCTGDTKPTAVKHGSEIVCAGDTKEAVVKHEPTQCDTNVIVNDMHTLHTNDQKPIEIGYVQSDLKNEESFPKPSQYIEESQLKDDASSRPTEDGNVSPRASAVEEAKLPLTEHNPAAISHGSDVVCTGDTKPTAVKHDSDIACAGDTKEAVVKYEATQCDTNVIVNDMHTLRTNDQKPNEIGYVQSDRKNEEFIPNPSQYIEDSQSKDDASSRPTEDGNVSLRTSVVEESERPLTEHRPTAVEHGSDITCISDTKQAPVKHGLAFDSESASECNDNLIDNDYAQALQSFFDNYKSPGTAVYDDVTVVNPEEENQSNPDLITASCQSPSSTTVVTPETSPPAVHDHSECTDLSVSQAYVSQIRQNYEDVLSTVQNTDAGPSGPSTLDPGQPIIQTTVVTPETSLPVATSSPAVPDYSDSTDLSVSQAYVSQIRQNYEDVSSTVQNTDAGPSGPSTLDPGQPIIQTTTNIYTFGVAPAPFTSTRNTSRVSQLACLFNDRLVPVSQQSSTADSTQGSSDRLHCDDHVDYRSDKSIEPVTRDVQHAVASGSTLKGQSTESTQLLQKCSSTISGIFSPTLDKQDSEYVLETDKEMFTDLESMKTPSVTYELHIEETMSNASQYKDKSQLKQDDASARPTEDDHVSLIMSAFEELELPLTGHKPAVVSHGSDIACTGDKKQTAVKHGSVIKCNDNVIDNEMHTNQKSADFAQAVQSFFANYKFPDAAIYDDVTDVNAEEENKSKPDLMPASCQSPSSTTVVTPEISLPLATSPPAAPEHSDSTHLPVSQAYVSQIRQNYEDVPSTVQNIDTAASGPSTLDPGQPIIQTTEVTPETSPPAVHNHSDSTDLSVSQAYVSQIRQNYEDVPSTVQNTDAGPSGPSTLDPVHPIIQTTVVTPETSPPAVHNHSDSTDLSVSQAYVSQIRQNYEDVPSTVQNTDAGPSGPSTLDPVHPIIQTSTNIYTFGVAPAPFSSTRNNSRVSQLACLFNDRLVLLSQQSSTADFTQGSSDRLHSDDHVDYRSDSVIEPVTQDVQHAVASGSMSKGQSTESTQLLQSCQSTVSDKCSSTISGIFSPTPDSEYVLETDKVMFTDLESMETTSVTSDLHIEETMSNASQYKDKSQLKHDDASTRPTEDGHVSLRTSAVESEKLPLTEPLTKRKRTAVKHGSDIACTGDTKPAAVKHGSALECNHNVIDNEMHTHKKSDDFDDYKSPDTAVYDDATDVNPEDETQSKPPLFPTGCQSLPSTKVPFPVTPKNSPSAAPDHSESTYLPVRLDLGQPVLQVSSDSCTFGVSITKQTSRVSRIARLYEPKLVPEESSAADPPPSASNRLHSDDHVKRSYKSIDPDQSAFISRQHTNVSDNDMGNNMPNQPSRCIEDTMQRSSDDARNFGNAEIREEEKCPTSVKKDLGQDLNNNRPMSDRNNEDENPPTIISSPIPSFSSAKEQPNVENSGTDVSFAVRSEQLPATFCENSRLIQPAVADGFEYIKSHPDGFHPGSSTDPADVSSSSDNTIPIPGRVKSDELGLISKNISRYKPHYCTGCSVDEYEKPAWCPDYKSMYGSTESDEEPMSDMCPKCKGSMSSLIGQTDVDLMQHYADSRVKLYQDDEPYEHTILHADSSTSNSTVPDVASVSRLIDSQSEDSVQLQARSSSTISEMCPATPKEQDLELAVDVVASVSTLESQTTESVQLLPKCSSTVSTICSATPDKKDSDSEIETEEEMFTDSESTEPASVPTDLSFEESMSKSSQYIEESLSEDDVSSIHTELGNVSSRTSATTGDSELQLTEHKPAVVKHGSDTSCTGDTKPAAVKHGSALECNHNVIDNEMHTLDINDKKPNDFAQVLQSFFDSYKSHDTAMCGDTTNLNSEDKNRPKPDLFPAGCQTPINTTIDVYSSPVVTPDTSPPAVPGYQGYMHLSASQTPVLPVRHNSYEDVPSSVHNIDAAASGPSTLDPGEPILQTSCAFGVVPASVSSTQNTSPVSQPAYTLDLLSHQRADLRPEASNILHNDDQANRTNTNIGPVSLGQSAFIPSQCSVYDRGEHIPNQPSRCTEDIMERSSDDNLFVDAQNDGYGENVEEKKFPTSGAFDLGLVIGGSIEIMSDSQSETTVSSEVDDDYSAKVLDWEKQDDFTVDIESIDTDSLNVGATCPEVKGHSKEQKSQTLQPNSSDEHPLECSETKQSPNNCRPTFQEKVNKTLPSKSKCINHNNDSKMGNHEVVEVIKSPLNDSKENEGAPVDDPVTVVNGDTFKDCTEGDVSSLGMFYGTYSEVVASSSDENLGILSMFYDQYDVENNSEDSVEKVSDTTDSEAVLSETEAKLEVMETSSKSDVDGEDSYVDGEMTIARVQISDNEMASTNNPSVKQSILNCKSSVPESKRSNTVQFCNTVSVETFSPIAPTKSISTEKGSCSIVDSLSPSSSVNLRLSDADEAQELCIDRSSSAGTNVDLPESPKREKKFKFSQSLESINKHPDTSTHQNQESRNTEPTLIDVDEACAIDAVFLANAPCFEEAVADINAITGIQANPCNNTSTINGAVTIDSDSLIGCSYGQPTTDQRKKTKKLRQKWRERVKKRAKLDKSAIDDSGSSDYQVTSHSAHKDATKGEEDAIKELRILIKLVKVSIANMLASIANKMKNGEIIKSKDVMKKVSGINSVIAEVSTNLKYAEDIYLPNTDGADQDCECSQLVKSRRLVLAKMREDLNYAQNQVLKVSEKYSSGSDDMALPYDYRSDGPDVLYKRSKTSDSDGYPSECSSNEDIEKLKQEFNQTSHQVHKAAKLSSLASKQKKNDSGSSIKKSSSFMSDWVFVKLTPDTGIPESKKVSDNTSASTNVDKLPNDNKVCATQTSSSLLCDMRNVPQTTQQVPNVTETNQFIEQQQLPKATEKGKSTLPESIDDLASTVQQRIAEGTSVDGNMQPKASRQCIELSPSQTQHYIDVLHEQATQMVSGQMPSQRTPTGASSPVRRMAQIYDQALSHQLTLKPHIETSPQAVRISPHKQVVTEVDDCGITCSASPKIVPVTEAPPNQILEDLLNRSKDLQRNRKLHRLQRSPIQLAHTSEDKENAVKGDVVGEEGFVVDVAEPQLGDMTMHTQEGSPDRSQRLFGSTQTLDRRDAAGKRKQAGRSLTPDSRFMLDKELVESHNRKLQTEVTTLQTENKLLKEKYNRSQARIDDLETQLGEAQVDLATLQESLDQEMADLTHRMKHEQDKDREEIHSTVKSLSKENQSLKTEVSTLTKRLDASHRNTDLTRTNTEKTRTIDAYKSEITSLKDELVKVKALLAQSERHVKDEEERHDAARKDILKLTELKNALQQHPQSATDGSGVTEKQVESLEQRLKVTEDRLHQERADRANNLSAVENKLLTDNARLQAAEKDLTRQLHREKEKNRNFEQRVKQLREDNEKLRLAMPFDDATLLSDKGTSYDIPYGSHSRNRAETMKHVSDDMNYIMSQIEKQDGLQGREGDQVIRVLWNKRELAYRQLHEYDLQFTELQLSDINPLDGLKNLRDTYGQAESKLKTMEEEVEDSKCQASTLESTYKQQVNVLVQERHDAFARLKTAEDLLEAVRAENEILHQNVQLKHGPHKNIASNSGRSSVEALQAEIGNLEGKCAHLTRANQVLEGELSTLRVQLKARDKSLQDVQSELDVAYRRLQGDDSDDDKQQKIDQLSARVNEVQVELKLTTGKLHSVTTDNSKLETELSTLKRQSDSNKAKLHKTEQIESRVLQQLKDDIAEKDSQIGRINKQIDDLENKLEKTRQDLYIEQMSTAELESENESLQENVAQRAQMFEALSGTEREQLAQYQILKETLDGVSQELAQKSAQIISLDVNLSSQRDRCAELEEANVRLRKDINQEKSDSQDFSEDEQSSAHQLKIKELEKERGQLKQELEQVYKAVQAAEEQYRTLQTESAQLEQELVKEKTVILQITAEKGEVEQHLEELAEEHEALILEKSQSDEDIMKLETKMQEILEKYETEAKKQHNDFEKKYPNLPPEAKKVVAELDALRLVKDGKDKEIAMLEDRLNRQNIETEFLHRKVELIHNDSIANREDVARMISELTLKMKESVSTREVNQFLVGERSKLQNELSHLRKELELERKNNDERRREIKDVIRKIEKTETFQKSTEKDSRNKENALIVMEAEMKHLKDNLATHQAENTQLKNKVDRLTEDVRNLTGINATMEKRIEMDQKALSEEKNLVSKWKDDFNKLSQDFEILRHEHAVLTDNYNAELQAMEHLRTDKESLQSDNERLTESLKASELELDIQKGQLLITKDTVQKLNSDKGSISQDYDGMCRSLTEKERQLSELRSRMEDKISHMEQLHQQEKLRLEQDKHIAVQELDMAKNDMDHMNEQLKQKEIQLNSFGKTLQELEEVSKEKRELAAQVHLLETNTQDSKALVSGQRKEVMSLNEALAKQQERLARLESDKSVLQSEQKIAKDTLERESNDFRITLAELKSQHETERSYLNDTLTQAQSRLHSVEGSLSSASNDRDNMQAKCRLQENTIETMQSQLSDESTGRRLAEQSVGQLRLQLEDMKDQKNLMDARVMEAQHKASDAEEKRKYVEEKCEHLKKQMAEVNSTSNTTQASVKAKAEQIDKLKKEVNKMRQMMETQRQTLTGKIQKSALESRQKLERIEEERERINLLLQQTSAELDTARDHIASKNKQNLKLQEENLVLEDTVRECRTKQKQAEDGLKLETEQQMELATRFEAQDEELKRLRTFLAKKMETSGEADKSMWVEMNRVMQELSQQMQKHLDCPVDMGKRGPETTMSRLRKHLTEVESDLKTERSLHEITKTSLQALEDDCQRLRKQIQSLRRRDPPTSENIITVEVQRPARKHKNRMEAINAIIARSQTQAQALLASGGYLDDTMMSPRGSRLPQPIHRSPAGVGSPDNSFADDMSVASLPAMHYGISAAGRKT